MLRRIYANCLGFGLVTLFAMPTLAMHKVLDESVEFSELKPNYTLVSKLLGILKGMEPKALPEQTILHYDPLVHRLSHEKVAKQVNPDQDCRTRVDTTTTYPYCCFGHINVVFGDKRATGSAVLIGKNHALTAAHCLLDSSTGQYADECSFYAGLDGDKAPFGVAKVVQYYILEEYIRDKNPDFDMALIVLDRPLGMKVGHLGCLFSNDIQMFAEPINVTGYPGDKGGTTMWTMGNRVTGLQGETIHFNASSSPGQSGGPIWSRFELDDESGIHSRPWPLVVGLLSGGFDMEKLKQTGNAAAIEQLGRNFGPRLTEYKFKLIMKWMMQTGQFVVKLNRSPRLPVNPAGVEGKAPIAPAKSPGALLKKKMPLKKQILGAKRPMPAGPAAAVKATQPSNQVAPLPTSPVDYDPKINETDAEGMTALHRAVGTGNIEVVKALLLRWADVNIADKNGKTPLHLAVERCNKPMVELLLDNRADVNARDKQGMTPLHIVAQKDHVEIAEILIERGADVNARAAVDNRAMTPIEIAGEAGHQALVRLLFSKKAELPLHKAVCLADEEIVKLVIEKGEDINGDTQCSSPLFCAIRAGRNEMVRLLLEKGANVNVREDAKYGDTPLHVAVYNDSPSNRSSLNLEVVELLLKHGADVNAARYVRDGRFGGETPLVYAVQGGAFNHEGHLKAFATQKKIIELLLVHGANPYLKSGCKETAFYYVTKCHYLPNKETKKEIKALIKKLALPKSKYKKN